MNGPAGGVPDELGLTQDLAEFDAEFAAARAQLDARCPPPPQALARALAHFEAAGEAASGPTWWERWRQVFLVPALAAALLFVLVPPRAPAARFAWDAPALEAQLDGAQAALLRFERELGGSPDDGFAVPGPLPAAWGELDRDLDLVADALERL